MAEMYAGATPSTTNACSSSSSPPPPPPPPPEQDDISLFLHQILLRSSSSPGGFPGKQAQQSSQHHPAVQTPGTDGISTGIGVLPSSTGVYVPAGNVSSSSAGTIDNDPDDYDCESEEGFENLVEEMGARPAAPRNPSKRSRAAEVHNLSEKRRRSRINEKMKALQKLIPNSNKTDKASMLDEAIEYLKQLQLQVQMLTMRNGLGLYPMSTPGRLQPNQLSHLRMGFNEQNGSLNMNLAGLISSNQGTLATSILGPPIQCTNPNQPSPLPDFPHVINPESAFRLDSSIQAQHGPFQIHKSSEEICRDGLLPHPQIDTNHTHRNSSDFQMGVNAGIFGRDQPDSLQLTNSGIDTSTSAEAVKGERRTF